MLDSALAMLYTFASRLLQVCIVLIAQGDEQLGQEALNLKSILTNHEENNYSTYGSGRYVLSRYHNAG